MAHVRTYIGLGANVGDADTLVVTGALWQDNPEYQLALERGIPVLHRSQALAWLINRKRLVAVAGAHGKTTSTGMIVTALRELGADPSFVNGARMTASITLEEADAVDVPVANMSLCVVLSGNAVTYGDGQAPIARCRRDETGAIALAGDWCSTTDSADGCRDAFRLGADFAASAVVISGDCP